MGICSSTASADVSTSKLILPDGSLQEYAYPVRASYALQKHPSCFICNADEMEFDGVVSAVEGDEELHPGQLYFALPISCRRKPLQSDQMAELAVRASSALMKSAAAAKCGSRKTSVSPVMFSGDEMKPRRGGRRRMLSAIPESNREGRCKYRG